MMKNLDSELLLAIRLCQMGAELIERKALGPTLVRYKNGDRNNPVTQYDVEVGRVIQSGLAEALPEDFVLNEEDESSHAFAARKRHRRVWCLDPIDGTRGFVGKTQEFAIMLGLAIDGRAALGVLLAPAQKMLWAGVLQPGGSRRAFCWPAYNPAHEQPLAVSKVRELQAARLVLSGMRGSRLVEEVVQDLDIRGPRKRLASVGLKAARIAAGESEVYISASNKTHEWDACAPQAVAEAAGASVTDLCGDPLRYNKEFTPTPRGMLFSHGPHQNALVGAIRKIGRRIASPTISQILQADLLDPKV